MADIPVTIRLRADGRGLRGDLAVTEQELARMQGQIDRTSRSTNRLAEESNGARQRLRSMAGAAAAAFAAFAAREILQAADTMTRLNARIQLVTDSSEEFERAQRSVAQVANESGRPLEAVGELYVRLSQSIGDNVRDQAELETITRAVTQSMRVSGASVAESDGAIRQLSQAFAAGVLRGDEFNSVNEQAPRLMQALADSLGVTRGELRGMAEDGELTAEVLQRALVDQADEIARESAQIPQTVGEAFTVLANQTLQLIGNFDAATGASSSLAQIITGVGRTIGRVADFFAENSTNIRLAGIAMVRGILLAFEDLRGGFRFLQGVTTEWFAVVGNGFNTVVATAANAAARLIEINAAAAGFIPGLDGVADAQLRVAASLRETAAGAEANIVDVRNLSEVWAETRAEVDSAKAQIELITSDMADQAIAAGQAAGATGDLADATGEVKRQTTEAIPPTEELVKAYDSLLSGIEGQIDSLREQEARLRGGTEAVLDYRRAQLIAQGATQDMVDTFDRMARQLLEQEDSLQRTRAEYDQFEASAQRVAQRMIDATLATIGFGNSAERSAQQLTQLQRAGQQIGSNFAQAVLNGQSPGDAIASSFTAAGGEAISESLGNLFSDALENGFEGLADSDAFETTAEGFMLAIGQAAQGNIGQAVFTAVGNAIGGPVGAVIGSIIGDLIFGESVPKFQVRGTRATRATDEGTDRVIDGALGQIEFAFRDIAPEVQRQVVEGFVNFDEQMAGIIRDQAQLEQVTAALDRVGVSSRSDGEDLGTLLQIRFDAILGTFDAFTQGFVAQADTLESQVQRLADVQAIGREVAAGRGLGFGSVQGTLEAVDALRIGSETLGAAFVRLRDTMVPLDQAAALVNRALGETREAALRFGSDLLAFFGDDAGQLSSALDTVFGRFFSEEEIASQTADAARARARELLESIGLTVTEEMLTEQGFRQIFDELFGTLGPEQTAALIEAGVAIDRLLGAEETLAEARGEAADAAEDAAARQRALNDFLQSTGATTLQALAPARLEFTRLNQAIGESFAAAAQLDDSERALAVARLSANVQLQGFISSLRVGIAELNQQLFGGGGTSTPFDAIGQSINTAAGAATNFRDQWLSAVQAIEDVLNDQALGPNSSLTGQERLQEALRQFSEARAAAVGGDLSAAQALPQLFREALAQGASFYGTTTDEFGALEQQLRNALESADLPVPPQSPDVQTATNTAATAAATQGIEQTAFQQYQAAISLIDQIGLLARLTDQSPAAIGREFGVPIAELMEILTGAAPEATGEVLDSMFNGLADSIGEDLNELAGLESINTDMLTELRGIRELLGGVADFGPPASAGPAPDPGFYAGGIAGRRGRERIVVGEMGPEAILSAEVTRGLQRAGIPVNSDSPRLAAEIRSLRAQVTRLLEQGNNERLAQRLEQREIQLRSLRVATEQRDELRKRSRAGKPALTRA